LGTSQFLGFHTLNATISEEVSYLTKVTKKLYTNTHTTQKTVGVSIVPPVAKFEATRAEATQNYNNMHTPHKDILSGNQST
jgi:hypothetical protein